MINKVSASNVVFDLGGVMVKITHTWEGAAKSAGVFCRNLGTGATPFVACLAFDEYQAGLLSTSDYLAELAKFLGCEEGEALSVHNGILLEEYSGIDELVGELQSRGLRTGCLSNTNEPHWAALTESGRFPTVESLDMKMASHLVGINKPDPGIFWAYSDAFGLESESIIFFDDYLVNVEAALKCGWNARWIDSSIDTPTQMRAHLADLGVI